MSLLPPFPSTSSEIYSPGHLRRYSSVVPPRQLLFSWFHGWSMVPAKNRLQMLCLLCAGGVVVTRVVSPVAVDAGILSGFSGLESIPGPELPQIDFLKQWSEEKQKKYAELDSRFKSSTVLKELLEKSKLNKARNQRELQDKYCIRGAEWGVGDCSTQGMTQEERDAFIAELKKRSGE